MSNIKDNIHFATLKSVIRDYGNVAWDMHCAIVKSVYEISDRSDEENHRTAAHIMAGLFDVNVTEFFSWKDLEKVWEQEEARLYRDYASQENRVLAYAQAQANAKTQTSAYDYGTRTGRWSERDAQIAQMQQHILALESRMDRMVARNG